MGRSQRPKPKRLAEKLAAVRQRLGIETFEEMIRQLDCSDLPLHRSDVSQYEKGRREPPLPVLLKYARLANVYLDVLVDDEIELPSELPSKIKSAGLKE